MKLGSCVFFVFLIGCRGSFDQVDLKAPLGSDPGYLDPTAADTGSQVFVLRQVVSTLLRADDKGRLSSGDAQDWKWSKDGKTLELKLRSNLNWSDGVSVAACQYRSSLLRALDPQVVSPLADILFDIKGARNRKAGQSLVTDVGVSCDDAAGLLRIDVVQPFSVKTLHALSFVLSAPVREDLLTNFGNEWVLGGVSTGAYRIKKWTRNRRIDFEATDRLKQVKGAFQRIALILVPDPLTAFRLFESGDLDLLTEFTPNSRVLAQRKYSLEHSPLATTYFVGYSFAPDSPMRSLPLRQAMFWAARQDEIPGLLQGPEIPARYWIPPSLWSVDPPVRVSDLAKAKSIKSRYSLPKNPIPLHYNAGERHQLLMERLAFVAQEALGLKIQLEPMEWKALVAELKVKPPALYRYAWTAVYPDPIFFLELFASDSVNNFGRYSNKRFDQILKSLQSVAYEERGEAFWALIREAERILVVDDPAILPMYHYVGSSLAGPRVDGLKLSLQGLYSFEDLRERQTKRAQ